MTESQSTPEPQTRPDGSGAWQPGPPDPWDAHAAWWQDEFTEGADPEYVEQILPLIASRLPAEGRVLDVGHDEMTLSLDADPSRLDDLEELLRPFGIIDLQRTGRVALARLEHVAP